MIKGLFRISTFTGLILLTTLLIACSNTPSSNIEGDKTPEAPIVSDVTNTPKTSDSATTKDDELPEKEENPVEENPVEEKPSVPVIHTDTFDIPDTEGLAFVKDMRIGWNLGNTFDANECHWLENELDYESAWNGVKTTPEMISDLKTAGFNTIRIPVSWHDHVDSDNQISEVWLARVNEVVDYAVANDLYIILNTHHDYSTEFMYPTSEHYDTSVKFLTDIWQQLAQRFKDYDHHLVFESLNEPRMVDTQYEWWLVESEASCIDSMETINKLNQSFVDTVRASGGNNADRYLLMPGYDASPEGALAKDFALPTDTVEGRIIVSVHAYTPYPFALQETGANGSTNQFDIASAASTTPITSFMDQLYQRYISQGIPVLIGEFGARDKRQNRQDRLDFATYYVAQAKARGMTCLWWDNNAFTGNGELFGLYERSMRLWVYQDIVDGMMKYLD